MTFEEIYTKAIDEIKQDPVSFVWNNYIKKHDDQPHGALLQLDTGIR